MDAQIEKMPLNMDEIYILLRPTRNSEVTPNERGSIIIYRRNFGFDNGKKNFGDKLMSEKKKKEIVKMVDL